MPAILVSNTAQWLARNTAGIGDLLFLIRNLYPRMHSLLWATQRPQTGVTRSPGDETCGQPTLVKYHPTSTIQQALDISNKTHTLGAGHGNSGCRNGKIRNCQHNPTILDATIRQPVGRDWADKGLDMVLPSDWRNVGLRPGLWWRLVLGRGRRGHRYWRATMLGPRKTSPPSKGKGQAAIGRQPPVRRRLGLRWQDRWKPRRKISAGRAATHGSPI